jgi:hypothetical protein
MSNSLKWSGYLIVDGSSVMKDPNRPGCWKPSARLTKNTPDLNRGEVAIKISVELPASLFLRPQLEAKFTVPADSVSPPVIDTEVTDNVAAIIRQNTGFDVRFLPQEGGGE